MKETKKQSAAVPTPGIDALTQLKSALAEYNGGALKREIHDEAKIAAIVSLAMDADSKAASEARQGDDSFGPTLNVPNEIISILGRVRAYAALNRGVDPRKVEVEGEIVEIRERYTESTSGREAIARLGAQILEMIDSATRTLETRNQKRAQKLAERSHALDFWLEHETARPFVEAVMTVFDMRDSFPHSTLDHALTAMSNVITSLRHRREDVMPVLPEIECVNELRRRAQNARVEAAA